MNYIYEKNISISWFLGGFAILTSILLQQFQSALFSSLMLLAAFIGYHVIRRHIQVVRKQVIVYWIFTFLIGFPMFYISEQLFSKHAEHITVSQVNTVSTYQVVTKKMIATSAEEFISILPTKEHIILFVGQESCPFCVQFIRKVNEISIDSIYYMDTEDKTDAFYAFADKYDVSSIPQLIYFYNGELSEKLDIFEETTPAQIQEFISRQE